MDFRTLVCISGSSIWKRFIQVYFW